MQFLNRALLPFTVFVTGACVLVIEIVATRILAPYFGNTIYSVSSVISVVLAALSVGYWIGGRAADKFPSRKVFFGIIAFSGILVLLIQVLRAGLLPTLGYSLPLTFGPLVMSLILFFIPSFILGMLSPFAVALQQRENKRQGVGTTAGQIFFYSTVGSIVGSLLAGFVLIPAFGVTSIILGVGTVLCVLGVVPLLLWKVEQKIAVIMLLAAGSALFFGAADANRPAALYSRDGVYEHILVAEGTYGGWPIRYLQQDTSNSAAAYVQSDELVYEYTKYYALHEAFTPEVKRALVMGGGAYSIPKALLKDLSEARVDVSEIEPSLVPLAEKYFGLEDNPRLTHYIEDGRRMLHDTPHRYDVIFSDVYHSMYSVPAHFTTTEFMQLARSRLTSEGVFIANLIGSTAITDKSFIWSQLRTMQRVFPQVYLFGVESPTSTDVQNIIAVGSMSPKRVDVNDPEWLKSKHAVVRDMAGHAVDLHKIPLERYAVLTDDYAPVDNLTASILPKR